MEMCQPTLAAENFNGSGHLNASGGEAVGETLEQVVERLKAALPKYIEYIQERTGIRINDEKKEIFFYLLLYLGLFRLEQV